MNILSTFRLLADFLPIVLLVLISFQCTSKGKSTTRKVSKARPTIDSRKSKENGKKKSDVEKKSSGEDGEKKPSAEEEDAPLEMSATPLTAQGGSSRRKKKTVAESVLAPTQRMETNKTAIQPPSTTVQVCPTQEDDVTALNKVVEPKKKKRKFKEEYFEDQNDDDTLGCVKSIEN